MSAFADGETRVRIEGEVRAADLYIVQPTSPPVNERLVTLALLADAARAAGAARLTAVVPYFGYARQDVRKNAGEPRSAQVAARILECAGIERLVALELHSPSLEAAFRIPLMHLAADEMALPVIKQWRLPALTVVSPDAGGMKRAQRYAGALGAPLAVVAKTRPQPDAAAAGAGKRTWRAYLSTSGDKPVNARDRIGTGPWYNAEGVRVAQNVDELHGDANNLTKETVLNERGEQVNGRGDEPNRHDILTGSQLDGTAFTDGADHTCQNWTGNGEGSAQVGHHDRTGGGDNPTSWNAAHGSRGCSQTDLQGTGGDGLFYCFRVAEPGGS